MLEQEASAYEQWRESQRDGGDSLDEPGQLPERELLQRVVGHLATGGVAGLLGVAGAGGLIALVGAGRPGRTGTDTSGASGESTGSDEVAATTNLES